jgi:hypothetical protein
MEEKVKQLASKLRSACYSSKSLKSIMSQKVWEQFIFLMCTPPRCMVFLGGNLPIESLYF